eukprot:1755984-Amphidinium_carterae.1
MAAEEPDVKSLCIGGGGNVWWRARTGHVVCCSVLGCNTSRQPRNRNSFPALSPYIVQTNGQEILSARVRNALKLWLRFVNV